MYIFPSLFEDINYGFFCSLHCLWIFLSSCHSSVCFGLGDEYVPLTPPAYTECHTESLLFATEVASVGFSALELLFRLGLWETRTKERELRDWFPQAPPTRWGSRDSSPKGHSSRAVASPNSYILQILATPRSYWATCGHCLLLSTVTPLNFL